MRSNRIERNSFAIVFILLLGAFFVRLYAITTIPIGHFDEEIVSFARHISFDLDDLRLPIGVEGFQTPLLSVYVVKIGAVFFGENIFILRLFFAFLGVLSLFFIYKLVESRLGIKTALLSLYLLIFSQYHIGVTRLFDGESLAYVFLTGAVYTFFKALDTGRAKYAYWTAFLTGVGCLAYEVVFLMTLIFPLFLITGRNYRLWFKRKEFYLSICLMCIIVLPCLIWTYNTNLYKLNNEHVFTIGVSLRAFYLYFGEIFAWVSEHSNFFIWDLKAETIHFKSLSGTAIFLSGISNEWPFIHWVLGVLIFAGAIYCLIKKNKNELIKFCLIMFSFIFLAASVIAGGHSLLDDHWWAGITLFPGVILCSHMLMRLIEKHRFSYLVIIGLMVYFPCRSFYFINLPESQFSVPKAEAHDYYLDKAEMYLMRGKKDLAAERCQWVLSRTKNSASKERAEDILSKIR